MRMTTSPPKTVISRKPSELAEVNRKILILSQAFPQNIQNPLWLAVSTEAEAADRVE